MVKKKFFIALICMSIFAYLSTGLADERPVEEKEVVSGFGVNIEKKKGETVFTAPSLIYTFGDGDDISTEIRQGESITPGETRESRQLVSDKKYILGLERIYIISDDMANVGLKRTIEIFFRNPFANDNAFVALYNGDPEHILEFKTKGYPGAADFIEGMLRSAKSYNFFSSNYKLSDIFLNMATEGKSLILPSIDIVDNDLKLTGMTIFKKDKMIGTLDIKRSKILNMLNDTDGKGIVTFQINSDKYIDYYASVKRKVKVYKIDDKYKYVVNLKFTGDIISDTIYSGIVEQANISDVSIDTEIKNKLETVIKEECSVLINELQNIYKVDALQLGQYAVGKYGRDKDIDWDKVFTEAEIEINPIIKIDRRGRGEYYKGHQIDENN